MKRQVVHLAQNYAPICAGGDGKGEKWALSVKSSASKKALFLTMITTYGVENNTHWGLAQNDLTMDVLFEGE